jgi:excisionase family DNA binding protein
MDKVWYSTAEAAEYLGVSVKRVRKLIRDDELPHKRIGPRTVRIHIDDLDDYDKEDATA